MGRPSNKLSARKVETARDGFWSDGGSLYLKVADDGRRRSWVFRFVRDGKVTSMGLGAASAVSLKEARAKRDELAKLLAQGVNPLTERRKNRLANAQRKTFADAAQVYIAQRTRDWSTSSLTQWKHTVERYCASIANLYVDEIGLDDVKRVVTPLADRGLVASARQTQSRIQTLLNYAVEHGWRPEDRRSAWSPVAKRPKGESPHHPMLPWAEAPAVVAALRESDGLAARVLEYVILTAIAPLRRARSPKIGDRPRCQDVDRSRKPNKKPPAAHHSAFRPCGSDHRRVRFASGERPAVLRPPRQASGQPDGGLGAMPAVDRREGVAAWFSGDVSQLVRGPRGRVRAGRERVGACIRGRHQSLPEVWACRATPPADAGVGRFS